MLNVPTLLKHLQLTDSMQFTYYPDISRVTIFYYINKVAGYISDYMSKLTDYTEATVCMMVIEQHQFWIEPP